MHNLYLVGFMGTGKTTIGRLVAGRTGRGFADLDELIELKEKRLIRDIFAEKGEAYFRRVEKQALREVAREDDFIVACGGGIVIDPDNIAMMKRTGAMVCLTASPGAILRRTQGQSNRPLLNVKDPKAQI
ncbi:MAG: shikimate kinase, partial [Candidatus Omnitrophica bacterium]|nr:shikimate kinase [Candidatus Omnitrophota bacterium]